MYVLKLFRVTAGKIHSFRIRSKKKLFGSCIQRIHLRRGSFGSIIRFWILVKKRTQVFLLSAGKQAT